DTLHSGGADGDDPGEPGAPEQLPSPEDVIAALKQGRVPDLSHLRALSEPSEDILRECLSLWPALEPARRREVLASLERLSEEDGTHHFHRIALTALCYPETSTRILAVRGLWQELWPEYLRL